MGQTTTKPKPISRWYQFRLRTLLVLVTLFAIFCSWYAVEMRKAAKRRAAIAWVEEHNGWVRYYDANELDPVGEPPAWYSWLRKLHGDQYLGYAISVYLSSYDGNRFNGTELIHLKDLTTLRGLSIRAELVRDNGLEHLKGLTELEWLVLSDTDTTDEAVKKLQEALPNCKIQHSPFWSYP